MTPAAAFLGAEWTTIACWRCGAGVVMISREALLPEGTCARVLCKACASANSDEEVERLRAELKHQKRLWKLVAHFEQVSEVTEFFHKWHPIRSIVKALRLQETGP